MFLSISNIQRGTMDPDIIAEMPEFPRRKLEQNAIERSAS